MDKKLSRLKNEKESWEHGTAYSTIFGHLSEKAIFSLHFYPPILKEGVGGQGPGIGVFAVNGTDSHARDCSYIYKHSKAFSLNR